MKLTFIETPVFTELITALLEDADYRQMQEHLLIAIKNDPEHVITALAPAA